MPIMKVKKYIKNPYLIPIKMQEKGFGCFVSDKLLLKCLFFDSFHYRLNLKKPKSFNEKLQWLKLYDHKPIYTTMVDKYEAKEYVASIIGKEYIIPTLGVWERFDDIDFNSLPNQFVLKCTHDSGGLVICRDKSSFDIYSAEEKINECLKRNYYSLGREWPYKNVMPRIIAEQYIEDSCVSELRDYKFFCFNGLAKCFKVDFDRFVNHCANYYDMENNLIKIGEVICPPNPDKTIELPDSIPFMKELAEKLSKDIPFLRTDFYHVDGKIYFGELTFYPASGFGKFCYDGNDELLGSWLKISDEKGGGYLLITKKMVIRFLPIAVNKKDANCCGINDYKIFCFNGEPRIIQLDYDRFTSHHRNLYDIEWNRLPFDFVYKSDQKKSFKKPKQLSQMLELSRKLSKNNRFLRCDFYIVNNKIYFGELTFFPESGFGKFIPEEWNNTIGDWIELPKSNILIDLLKMYS